jgi:1,4-dihydroxy-2-naphthoyl-CoA synthase
MRYEQIDVTVDDGVMVLTLSRPEQLNAWTARMGAEMSDALRRADVDDAVRVVVLTGAGRAFCAGADLSTGGATFNAAERERDEAVGGELVLPWQIRKPVIAAINGHAVGVGITLPLCADVRFVAEDAKVQFAFVRRGMMPELAAHVLLARVAGVSVAADLLLSGRMVSGRELCELRIANRTMPASEVLPAALEWARDVARNAAPVSVALTKQMIWSDIAPDLRAMSRRETPPVEWLGKQADAVEGITAFLEKREPRWSLRVSADLPPFGEA